MQAQHCAKEKTVLRDRLSYLNSAFVSPKAQTAIPLKVSLKKTHLFKMI